MAAKRLDADQRAAVHTTENTVVVAGAGSGKTTVLAQRFAHLVTEDRIAVDRILTLTFTRKAAAEMHERIHRLLKSHEADAFVAEQLLRFDEAQISTLDSFCGRIVRAAAGQFGVAPDYRTDEVELGELARALSRDFLVRNRRNPVLARLVAANGFDAVLHEGFVPLATNYLTLVPEQDFTAQLDAQLHYLAQELARGIDALRELVEELRAVETQPSAAFDRTRDAVSGVDWAAMQPPDEISEAFLLELSERLRPFRELKKSGGAKGDPGAPLFKDAIEAVRDHAGRLAGLIDTLRLRDDLGELFTLVASFRDELSDRKRRRGILSYRDVLAMAVHALEELPAVRRFFAGRFDRIMIDEFQDNNEEQKRLLYLLSLDAAVLARHTDRPLTSPGPEMLAPGKLFFVGDEKQSIYRFRGADVRAFKGLAGELAAQGSEPVILRTNYRSAASLIAFFNHLFSRVMEQDADAGTSGADAAAGGPGLASDYEARFEALRPGPAADEQPASVEVLYAPYPVPAPEAGEDLLRPDEAEAYLVAQRILEAVRGEAREVVDDDGSSRPPAFHEIALLLRSSGNQIIFERVFRALGIPYQTQSVRSLYLEAPAYDVYAWLRLVTVPEDVQAYAAVLRSPLAGLSDDAVGILLTALPAADPAAGTSAGAPDAPSGESPEPQAPAAAVAGPPHPSGEAQPFGATQPFGAPPEVLDRLTEADTRRYEAAAHIYRDLESMADVEDHTVLISRLWNTYGYRYVLLRDRSLHGYAEHYDYLLELARVHAAEPLAAFAEVLRSQLGSYRRPDDVEVEAAEQRGVQVMTIHKSKGLEFPLVIVANAGNRGRNEGMGQSAFHISEQFGLTLNLPTPDWAIDNRERSNYFFEAGREEDKAREYAELKRLLYVAATRAQNHLIFSGVFNRNNLNQSDHILNMVLHALDVDPAGFAGGDRNQNDGAGADGVAGPGGASGASAASGGDGASGASGTSKGGAPAGSARPSEVVSLPGIDVALTEIPAAPRRVLYRRRARDRRDIGAYSRELGAAPTVNLQVARTDFAVTEIAAAVEEARWARGRASGEEERGPDAPGSVAPADAVIELDLSALPEGRREALFGTLAHAAADLLLREPDPDAARIDPEALPFALRRDVPPAAMATVLPQAEALAKRFLAGSYGRRLRAAATPPRVEQPFVLYQALSAGEAWITGQFDFLVEETETIVIIDLKSDVEVAPERHAVQMFLYRRAAERMFGRPAISALHYLRYDRTIEVNESVSEGEIEAAIARLQGQPGVSPRANSRNQ